MSEPSYRWRDPITDAEMVDLVESHGGSPEAGWWDRIQGHSLGWVSARAEDGLLVGFVNVAWDGGDHAFLIDTKTRGDWQRRGIGTEVVRVATDHAAAAGCEWLHVDFEADLGSFYFDACRFHPTAAGLVHLDPLRSGRAVLEAPTTADDAIQGAEDQRVHQDADHQDDDHDRDQG